MTIRVVIKNEDSVPTRAVQVTSSDSEFKATINANSGVDFYIHKGKTLLIEEIDVVVEPTVEAPTAPVVHAPEEAAEPVAETPIEQPAEAPVSE